MRVMAPGKLLLAGAYAVLEGSPALVLAVDRYAVANDARWAASPTPEVVAALDGAPAPEFDASSLRDGGHKLGLGSSAAILVASLGLAYARAGKPLADPVVRGELLTQARAAHSRVQEGGSGVDVAASVYGGVLAYTLVPDSAAHVEPLSLPRDVVVEVFWSGVPATTTSMRARVDALRIKDPRTHRARMDMVAAAARSSVLASRRGDGPGMLVAIRAGAHALAALGREADAPIFPPMILALVPLAERDDAAFLPSGAGGGDVFVHAGARPAGPAFTAAALAVGMRRLPMQLDQGGVRLLPDH